MDQPVEDRREEFLDGLIALCRKHRVLLEADWDLFDSFENDELPAFKEHGTSRVDFTVSIADVEHAVRDACWDDIHMTASDT